MNIDRGVKQTHQHAFLKLRFDQRERRQRHAVTCQHSDAHQVEVLKDGFAGMIGCVEAVGSKPRAPGGFGNVVQQIGTQQIGGL